jgi:Ca2+-binding RTX toxin-like protein
MRRLPFAGANVEGGCRIGWATVCRCGPALALLLVPTSSHAKPLKKVVAGPGNDRVEGTPSADYLNGGRGDDILKGGPDPDYFEWYLKPPVAYGRDLIEDFEKGSDRVIFEALLKDGYVCGFDGLDTDGSGVLDAGDRYVRIGPATVGGVPKQSTIIDVTRSAGGSGEQSLTIYGVVGFSAKDVLCDPDLPVQ